MPTGSKRPPGGESGFVVSGFRTITWVLAAIVSLGAGASAAEFSVTEDAGVAGEGVLELLWEAGYDRSDRDDALSVTVLDITYGVTDRIDLTAGLAWDFERPAGDTWDDSVSPINLGVKYLAFGGDPGDFALTLYPQIGLRHDALRHDEHNPQWEVLLPVQVGQRVGPFDVYAELGYLVVEADDDLWIYGLAIELPLNDRWVVGTEVFGEADSSGDDDWKLTLNSGIQYQLNDQTAIWFSGGTGLHRGPDLLLSLGVQFVFE
jgi:hypothetical protein